MKLTREDLLKSFNSDMSLKIKGIALIFMIIHHCFGFPDWYVNNVNYSDIVILGINFDELCRAPMELCVALFAFLTGWAYFYNKNKNLKYSIKKVLNFLINYWIILFLIFIPINILLKEVDISFGVVIKNMFALKNSIVMFAWYVYFYVFTMICLPFVVKGFSGKPVLDFLLFICGCVFFINILGHVEIERQYLILDLSNCFCWFQCVFIGYFCAKYKIFEYFYKYIYTSSILRSLVISIIILGCRLKWENVFNINLDIIYAPIIVFEMLNILNYYNKKTVNKILRFLGQNSVNVWFLHSIFFSEYTREYFQRIAFLPNNPILVVIWVIILCIPVSLILNYFMRYVYSITSKIF